MAASRTDAMDEAQEDLANRDSTSFEGSRREQLRRAQAMTVRQRLEAMDELDRLSERLRSMPRQSGADSNSGSRQTVGE